MAVTKSNDAASSVFAGGRLTRRTAIARVVCFAMMMMLLSLGRTQSQLDACQRPVAVACPDQPVESAQKSKERQKAVEERAEMYLSDSVDLRSAGKYANAMRGMVWRHAQPGSKP